MDLDQDERSIATQLSIRSFSQLINTGNPVMVIDTPPVQQGYFWIVERVSVFLEFDFSAAGPPAEGDTLGIYVCPPNQPPSTENATINGIPAIKAAIASRPIIIEQASLNNVLLSTVSAYDQLEVVPFGGPGPAKSWFVSLRNKRKFYVPSLWTVRAVANLQGDNGGIAATTLLSMNLMLTQLPNC